MMVMAPPRRPDTGVKVGVGLGMAVGEEVAVAVGVDLGVAVGVGEGVKVGVGGAAQPAARRMVRARDQPRPASILESQVPQRPTL